MYTGGDMIIRCEKCNSVNVEDLLNEELPPEKEVSMEDYAKGAGEAVCVNAVMVYHKYLVRCKACGHSIEYLA